MGHLLEFLQNTSQYVRSQYYLEPLHKKHLPKPNTNGKRVLIERRREHMSVFFRLLLGDLVHFLDFK